MESNKFFIYLLILILFLQLYFPAFSKEKVIEFSAVGDILLDRGIRMIMEKRGKDYPFKEISDYLSSRDLVLGNLEGPLSNRGEPLKKKYIFRGDPSCLESFREMGLNCISLANNHIMDYGDLALMDTIDYLKSAGLYPFGAGKNQEEALKPIIINKNGLVLSFFASLGYPLRIDGVASEVSGPCQVGLDEFIFTIKEIRDQVDFIIVSLHWGFEYEPLPHSHQIEFAHQLIDNGVDLIIGHHPHVIQGIERYRGKYILYSLGNFLFDQHDDEGKESFIFSCDIGEKELMFPGIIPIEISNYQTKLASKAKADKIIDSIQLVSDEGKLFLQKKGEKYYIKETN